MRILVDLYKIKDPFSGLGQYSLNFAGALQRHCPPGMEIQFLVPKEIPYPESRIPNPESSIQHPATFLQRYIPQCSPRADIWHCLHQFPSHLPHPQSKVILTVHDLNFLTGKSRLRQGKYLRRLQRNVNRASAVTVISEYTGKLLKEHIELGSRPLLTIPNGVSLNSQPKAVRPSWLPDRPFFFCLSVFKDQKNLHSLIPMMDHFPDHLLVMAGNNRTPYGQKVLELVAGSASGKNILFPGTVGDEEKYWLYNHCEAYLLPSLAEGFGLTVIEAMLAGKQVFLSREGSLPEVGGVLAFYWDSFEPGSMAHVLTQGLASHALSGNRRTEEIKAYASKFSWDRCIRDFFGLYQRLA